MSLDLKAQISTDNGMVEVILSIIDLTAFIHTPADTAIPALLEDGSTLWCFKENLQNFEVISHG